MTPRRGRAAVRRVARAAFLVAVAVAALPRATGAGAVPAAPARGGTLVVAVRGDVDSYNPYVTGQATAANILELLYPRLLHERFAGDEPSFVPWLASRWRIAQDGRTLTFFLRPDARWSDGRRVTCTDVRFTLQAAQSPELAWTGAALKEWITGIECPDSSTAVVRFARPRATAILDANDDAIVPAAYGSVPFKEWGSRRWEQGLVTSGPYRFVHAVPGQEIVLERDPRFWDAPRPYIDRIVFRVYSDATAPISALLAGEVDFVERVPPHRAAEVQANADLALLELPSLAYTFIAWNTLQPEAYRDDRKARGCVTDPSCPEAADDIRRLKTARPHPILADARVRRALTLGTDREDLVRGILAGRGRVGGSPIVSALWAHDPGATLPFDAAAARQLLEAAGWRDRDGDGIREKDQRPLKLEVIVDADNAQRREALERVAANLAAIGVRLSSRPLPRAEFIARARDKEFDGALFGWRAGSRIEPQAILHTLAAAQRGNNLGSWSTTASDALLDEAPSLLRTADARRLWQRWQAIFRDEQPYTVLYEEPTLIGIRRRVMDPTPSPLNPYDGIERWWLAPPP